MSDKTLVLLADYGIGDPAFTEVSLQLRTLLPTLTVLPQSTPAFSTLNTGFWMYQLALTPQLKNTYIYSNTAPRKETDAAQKNNKGEKLMYAKLKNGFEIMAVNAGFVFSLVKDSLAEFNYVHVENEGSQFRSRDKYPAAVARMIQGDYSILGEKGDTESIPDYPRSAIVSIDGYGNIKTGTRLSEVSFTPGQKLRVELNQQTHEAIFTDGVFNIESGQLAFAPGSSGHTDRFMELFVRGKSAAALFKNPNVEDNFTITDAH